MTIHISSCGPVRIIQFNHESAANPFSRDMQIAVTQAAREAGSDEAVRAVVFTGGENRMFSAGGDFNEVSRFETSDDVDQWIDTFMDMYLTLLTIPKPTLAAIDGHAIGIGFQVALMLDFRVMTTTAKLAMPELRHGIGGSVGGAILTALYGADFARETMLGALTFDAGHALERRLVQEIVKPQELMERTIARAQDYASFPPVSYASTKAAINKPVETTLRETTIVSKHVHRAAFKTRAMQPHFDKVLKR